jgi:UDPglucose 6-dehydrogenase
MEGNAYMTIGFIGQGWIGKNYADDLEKRGYSVVRYALEPEYAANKEKIAQCEIVFIAVPTPTTPEGFDSSIVGGVLPLVGKGNIAVIKSTIVPGTTDSLQKKYPDILVMHSPEFLTEKNAAYDAAHPSRTIIGIPETTAAYQEAAQKVLAVLPKAPFSKICPAREAEYVKYAANAFLFFKVLFANLMYDMAAADGCDWDTISECVGADPRIGPSHLKAAHASGHPGAAPGRGAGGHCFIKDFAALRALYEARLPRDSRGAAVLRSLECKNIELLKESGKDLDMLRDVYGDNPQICAS